MFARLTLLEIDTLRIDMAAAVELYRREVFLEVTQQPGYEGALVLTTPHGGAAVISFWATAEAAEAGGAKGFYPEILERYVTIFKAPPGRERYEVAFADLPMTAAT